ncbi:MAG: hypothetical protein M2R45_00117 [Verrucomicrobia subdivision 3 bacterium]|nr:hypothetical protein [Limisphaerales bacterium]MCS1412423.1 hypothetical protein [Limisphaerales bacterium]
MVGSFDHKKTQIADYKSRLTESVIHAADLNNGRQAFQLACANCLLRKHGRRKKLSVSRELSRQIQTKRDRTLIHPIGKLLGSILRHLGVLLPMPLEVQTSLGDRVERTD